MPDLDKNFDTLAIRDTATHNSSVSNTGEFNAETIVVYNGLDQNVSIQLQGSLDQTNWMDINDPFNIATTVKDYRTVTDYFPCYRLTAKCTTSPTSGALDAWLLKTR
jgi:hypothetical protein